LRSKHVKLIENEYRVFYEELVLWMDLIEHIGLLQERTSKLRVLFTNTRTARYIHQALRYFNIVDDSWRIVIKTARSENRLNTLMRKSHLSELLHRALDSSDKAFAVIQTFAIEQCERWPKLYLLSQSQLQDAMATAEPEAVFDICMKVLFPCLSSLTMHADQLSAIAVTSGEEVLDFRDDCSIRGSFSDWFRNIEKAMTDKLVFDVSEYLRDNKGIIDDCKNPACCSQSRILAYQVKFGFFMSELISNKDGNRSKLVKLKSLEVSDQMISLRSILSAKCQNQEETCHITSLFVLLIQYRDLLQKFLTLTELPEDQMQQDLLNSVDFMLHKRWTSATQTIVVKLFTFECNYQWKYHGYKQRLVVTPLTEKCYFAITNALYNHVSPFLRGSPNNEKINTLQDFGHECGFDVSVMDCSFENFSADRISSLVQAAMKGLLFMCFDNIEHLQGELLSHLLWTVTEAHNTRYRPVHTHSSDQTLADGTVASNATTATSVIASPQVYVHSALYVCLSMNTGTKTPSMECDNFYFPAAIRKRYRVMHYSKPATCILLEIYLEAFGFPVTVTQKLAYRLNKFFSHLQNTYKVESHLLHSTLLHDVVTKIVIENCKNNSTPDRQVYELLRETIQHLPLSSRIKIDKSSLPLLIKNFFGTIVANFYQERDFSRDIESMSTIDKLVDAMECYRCVVVTGSPSCGKSTLIVEAARSITGFERDEFGNYLQHQPHVPRKMYSHVLYPSLLLSKDEKNTFDADVINDTPANDVDLFWKLVQGVESVLADAQQKPDCEFVRFDMTPSVMNTNLLTYYASSSNHRAEGMTMLWECCSLADFDPSVLTTMAVVHVPTNLFSANNSLRIEIQAFCKR
jgi:hypothetical protein